jgi:hypothetical protein
MLIKCGCSLFRTILFLTSCNCKAPKMFSLQIALSLQPWIWSCCTYKVSFAICWMHLFDFFITMLYVLSYLIICPCCPNRCLRVIICAIGTNLFHDIELEVSFGESIYFISYMENLCNTSSTYPCAFSSYIFVCPKSPTCNSCFKFGQLHVTSNVQVFAYLNWYLSWYFVPQFYNLLLEVPCMFPVNPVQKYIVALHYL